MRGTPVSTPQPTFEAHTPLPTPLGANAAEKIATPMNRLLADVFALYVKTKNFHWHVSGPQFRECHLAFDEHADQIFAMVDPIAERVRKLGAPTLRSLGEIHALQRIADNDEAGLAAADMVRALAHDNGQLASTMRDVHRVCDELGDVATASLLETWIDEAEGRLYVLSATLVGAPA
jgi:starvation-inducible DNA-binding protein